MQAAFALVSGSTGGVIAGQGNYTVSRDAPGVYSITIHGSFQTLPVVVASPSGPYITAQVILRHEDGDPTYARFRLETGFTDQPNRMDNDFSFIAMWP